MLQQKNAKKKRKLYNLSKEHHQIKHFIANASYTSTDSFFSSSSLGSLDNYLTRRKNFCGGSR